MDRRGAEPGAARETAEVVQDLERELSRRREDQGFRRAARALHEML
jgi:hypothetical protein